MKEISLFKALKNIVHNLDSKKGKIMKLLITGGRGFIGSHFVESALERGHEIIDIDKMTYASNLILPWDNHANYKLIKKDINDLEYIPSCDVIVNFAAESHVDNSIKISDVFVRSNIMGVHNILELLKNKPKYERPLFFHISTDEVYGDILEGKFKETDRLKPSNPYSATKASAEMMVLSYSRTYDIDYIISRSGNNYGPRQYEEKLIPKSINNILKGKKIPIHGDGSYVRDWVYVKDNVEAIFHLIHSGVRNETYNIGSENYLTNLQVVDSIIDWIGYGEYEFVENRKGQDLRYAVSPRKINDLGWSPKHTQGIYRWKEF